MTEPAAPEPKVDLYALLGAEKSDDQHTITKKYKKMALKFHPDRNRGDGQEAAAEKFKAIADAYAVLSDPNRRHQYDLHGDAGDAKDTNAFETVDVKNANWATRFLLAQVSKLGVPIPTSISADVLSQAAVLAEDAAARAALPLLEFGVAHGGAVKLGSAAFYRVAVDARTAAAGLLLAAKSKRRNDKFRLIVFDGRGAVRRMAESLFPEKADRSRGAASKCRLFVLPVPTLLVGMPFPTAGEEHLPPVCAALDTLEERSAAEPPFTEPGEYLVALYSDNLLSSLDYTLAAAPADLDAPGIRAMEASAEGLRAKKKDLADFGDRFGAAFEDFVEKKNALAAAQELLVALDAESKQHETDVSELRGAHDWAQSALLERAFAGCAPPKAPAAAPPPPPARGLSFSAAFGSRAPAAPAGPVAAKGLGL